MDAIAIVDDRAGQRTTVRRTVEPLVGSQFDVIETGPLDEVTDYASWVIENDVVGMVVDERLSEQSQVDYSGHDVAVALRVSNFDLPIFILTAYPPDSDSRDKASSVENVIQRREFSQAPAIYVDRIVRASKRYSKQRTKALVELGDVARKIALGTATRAERRRAVALQTELHLNIGLDSVQTKAQWLNDMEGKFKEISDLRRKLEARIKGKTK